MAQPGTVPGRAGSGDIAIDAAKGAAAPCHGRRRAASLARPLLYRASMQTSTLPSLPRWAGYVAITVLVLAVFYALYHIKAVLFLLLIAILLATAIEPLVLRVRRGPFSRGQGILIVYTGIMLVILGLGALTVPTILHEAGAFTENYTQILEQARGLVYSVDGRVLGPAAERVVEKAAGPGAVADDGTTAVTVGLTLIEGLFAFMTVFVVAFYWLTERVAIKRALLHLFPRERQILVGTIWNDVERVLGGWVRGQGFVLK